MAKDNLTKVRFSAGSALLLTVVLTSLLAIIGVMFVLVSRVDEMSTSAVSDNKELNLAVETIVSRISNELVLDVPGVSQGEEYYDYPDPCNTWLASAGPDENTAVPGTYYWRQISDVTGYLATMGFLRNGVDMDPPGTRKTILEYPEIIWDPVSGSFLDTNGSALTDGLLADADGDGIADSKWIEFFNKSSNKGKPIYAAIRVIDNGAMLNVNTAYEFNLAGKNLSMMDSGLIDGSNQMQINLAGLANPGDTIAELHAARRPVIDDMTDSANWRLYKNNVIRRHRAAVTGYLPFDMSDELELRYRNCIISPAQTRLESTVGASSPGVWDYTISVPGGFLDVPYDGYSNTSNPSTSNTWRRLDDWYRRMYDFSDPEFDKRHMLTTLNMDRIIWPDGFSVNPVTTNHPDANVPKMLNVNRYANNVVGGPNTVQLMVDMILTAIPTATAVDAAQMAVNLRDYVDDDSVVSTYFANGVYYNGFERPCPVISELVVYTVKHPRNPNIVNRSFGIEIRKRLRNTDGRNPDVWRVVIDSPVGGGTSYYNICEQR